VQVAQVPEALARGWAQTDREIDLLDHVAGDKFFSINGSCHFAINGEICVSGLKQFAFSQSSFFAVALPLIGIDRD